jgi:nuclear pore complex protein Nup205
LSLSNVLDVPIIVAYHNACLAVVLRIAQTRPGAVLIFNGGIFSAVEESEIFAMDPDVGLGEFSIAALQILTQTDIDDVDALKTYFDLVLSIMRIINSIVLKYQSDQTSKSARTFLSRSRPCVTGVLKRFAKIGGVQVKQGIDLSDLVDNFTLLISATDFLEVSFLHSDAANNQHEDQTSVKTMSTMEFFS